MSSVPERSEIDSEYKWDLESIFETEAAWEAAYEETEARLDEIRAYEGRATEDGETLYELLELVSEVLREVSMVTTYAQHRRDQDSRDQNSQALASRASTLASRASSATSFIEPAIQSLETEELESMLAETPALEKYDHYLDDIHRLRAHTRTAEIENVLAELSEVTGTASDIYAMLTNADMSFPEVEGLDGEPVEVTQANFTQLQRRSDREFRRRVYEVFYDEFGSLRNTIATAYKNSVRADVQIAHIRNYETARQAAMDGPNVPVEVYDNLVSTVRENLGSLRRHAELKRRHLGVEDLHMWDLYMPLADGEEPEIPYEEAREYVVEAVAPLGEEYQSRLAEGLESRWVDVYENRGKRSGAYSGGAYDSQPFILMNYQDDVESMYTLAHELGHSLHSQFTKEHQPYVYSNYEIFVAEVASTVNEVLLTRYLLDTIEEERLRRFVLDQSIERFRSTLFRQTMFADFEHRTHRVVEDGDALTADRLDGIYGDLKSEFYADAVTDDRIAREWSRIPHFYSAYYVYQYSTGISAAISLVDDILSGDDDAADRYVEFLKRGSRTYPIELLSDAGVDMASPVPIEGAIDLYDDYLDEIEALL